MGMEWAEAESGGCGHTAGPGAGHRGGDATRRVEVSAALSQEQRGRYSADGYKRVLGEVGIGEDEWDAGGVIQRRGERLLGGAVARGLSSVCRVRWARTLWSPVQSSCPVGRI